MYTIFNLYIFLVYLDSVSVKEMNYSLSTNHYCTTNIRTGITQLLRSKYHISIGDSIAFKSQEISIITGIENSSRPSSNPSPNPSHEFIELQKQNTSDIHSICVHETSLA